ncbi:unnamed protein product [Urochloa decumbens]|uniref:Uncharacterized protein n=1 Tax=Urochloa decumbens TaxID=240449 RepID=A0ABC9BV87_9POAL
MPSSSSSSFTAAAAAGGGAIPSGPPSTLSPNAAPYTLLSRQARAPAGRPQDGDALRLIDDNFVLNGEDNNSYSVSLAGHFGMKQSDTVYPSIVYGIHKSQPSLSCANSSSFYPSPSSPVAIVSEPSVTIVSDFKQHQIPTSGKVTVTIRSPPSKTSKTDNGNFGSTSKSATRQNGESNKGTGKVTSFRGNLEFSNPASGNGTSQGTMVFSKELNPELSVKPHGPSACASPCVTVADDVNLDPSECSVDSPCWRGTASRLSPFDIHQTLVAQSVKQDSVAFDAVKEQSSSTNCEAQNLVASKSKQNHSQSHVELGLSKKTGDIGTNLTQDSHVKELEFVKHGAAECSAEKRLLEVIDDGIKRSGLNSAAPDFIPLSVRKANTSNVIGSCSSSGMDISEILKAIKSMSEVLCNNYSDEIELEEHDYSLLQSVTENLQSYLHKARKVPVEGVSDKAGGLKACFSQNAASKSVTRNYNGSHIADNGKGIIINRADSSCLPGDFRKKCVTGYQASLNNFPKEFSCEEDHSEALIYKKLWFDAERANCALKYQLKQTHMEIDLESSRDHIGGGPRIPSFHLCDTGADPNSSYGSAITSPLMLKDHPGGRKSRNLIYAADHILSGDCSVVSMSKGHITVPKNIVDEYFLSGLEETGVHPHVYSGQQVAPNRAHRGLDVSTSDGMSSLSYITGRDGISRGSCAFGSSDWEHVLKEEIGSI